MRSITIATTFCIVATSVLAAPFNSTAFHSFKKRDNVCALDFRSAVTKSDCIPKGTKYTLTPPSAMSRVNLAAEEKSSGPTDGQCDHLVEIQLLDFVAHESGICDILTAIKNLKDTTGTVPTVVDLLSPAHADISAVQNLNFLQDTVNGKKKDVVRRSFKNTAQEDGTLDKAVGNFLQLVKGDGTSIAARLDTDLVNIKTRASTVLAGLPGGTASGRRDPNKAKKDALDAAIKKFENSQVTVASVWQNLLRVAPHT